MFIFRILANRVYDLEQRLARVQDGVPVYPSQILLNGYSGSNVDKDLQSHQNNDDECITDNCDSNISNNDNNGGKCTVINIIIEIYSVTCNLSYLIICY